MMFSLEPLNRANGNRFVTNDISPNSISELAVSSLSGIVKSNQVVFCEGTIKLSIVFRTI